MTEMAADRGTERGEGGRGSFAFELAFEPATTSLRPPFREERPNVWPPTTVTSSLPPPDLYRECGLLGYHRRQYARPSPLPEAFPTNCSSERTTTKTKEEPKSPESVILLRWAQKFFEEDWPIRRGRSDLPRHWATSIFQDIQENRISCVFAGCHLG